MPAFRQNPSKLIEAAAARGWSIVRILHEDGDAHFDAASGQVRPLDWVAEARDVVFHRHVHNAFTDTGPEAWLRERGIGWLIVSGIRSEQCCETSTRVTSGLGFAVHCVTEATLTFPIVVCGATGSGDQVVSSPASRALIAWLRRHGHGRPLACDSPAAARRRH